MDQIPDATAEFTPAARHFRIDARQVQALPFRVYQSVVLILGIAGLGASIYLAVSHYRVFTDLSYQSFCALTKSINCDTVSQSPYAVLGNLPVAVWGLFGYGLFMLLALFSLEPPGKAGGTGALCLTLAGGFSLASLCFAAISSLWVGSYCIVCIATYGVNLLLLFYLWLIRRRFFRRSFFADLGLELVLLLRRRRSHAAGLALYALSFAVTYLCFPAYWVMNPPVLSQEIPSGITAEGHPWIGAATPLIEIVEYSDYMCFQCRKMQFYLRSLIARHPDKLRLIHFHYPMDHAFNPIVKEPFHIGSGNMALLAIHAAAAGKFWEMNDKLFEAAGAGRELDLARLAAEIGLDAKELPVALQHQPYHQVLLRDIRQGMKHRISATPSYVINGEVIAGGIPPDVLRPILEMGPAAGSKGP